MYTIKHYLLLFLLLLAAQGMMAQSTIDHKVKKKETIFGIAREYGLTASQLIAANPEMNDPNYKLKKGAVIKIPVVTATTVGSGKHSGPVKLGVLLPLHDLNGDGQRMVEYYRGVLMACDSLKKVGISVDVHAWNLPANGDVNTVLRHETLASCDLIIGPLYSKYMEALSDFTNRHDILLVIPFSINAPQLYNNKHIFQVYQPSNTLMETTAKRCAVWFKDYHFVIVDCQDANSTKGPFTSTLRRQLEVDGIRCNVTSLQSSFENFSRAFLDNVPNMVVLNSSSASHLLQAFTLLKKVTESRPRLEIAMFGYSEWMAQAVQQKQNFHRFNVYIPSTFFTNESSPIMKQLERKYRSTFNQSMQSSLPRFGVTGFDHALFFLRGVHQYGKSFDGAANHINYVPVQTPLRFERIGSGGFQNRSYLFVHYKTDGTIETLNY